MPPGMPPAPGPFSYGASTMQHSEVNKGSGKKEFEIDRRIGLSLSSELPLDPHSTPEYKSSAPFQIYVHI